MNRNNLVTEFKRNFLNIELVQTQDEIHDDVHMYLIIHIYPKWNVPYRTYNNLLLFDENIFFLPFTN